MTLRKKALRTDASQAPTEPSHHQRLLELAHQRALDGKGGLAASVAEMCLASSSGLTERELSLAFEILRLIIPKVEVKIRRHIADYLADRRDVPHDLILMLAKDDSSVAYPIILHSGLLREDDLLEVVTTRTKQHRQAVAMRPNITSRLTSRLVERTEPEVLITLLCNETAVIDHEALSRLVERSLEVKAYQEPLLHRKEMTAALARRIYIWAGDSLRDYIDAHYDTVENIVSEPAEQTAARPIGLRDSETAAQPSAMARRHRRKRTDRHQADMDTGRDLLRCLDIGDIAAFEGALANELDLPLSSVVEILYDSGVETLAAACKACGMDKAVFSEILCLLPRARPREGYESSPEYRQAMDYFDQIDYASASVALDRWRNTPQQARRA